MKTGFGKISCMSFKAADIFENKYIAYRDNLLPYPKQLITQRPKHNTKIKDSPIG